MGRIQIRPVRPSWSRAGAKSSLMLNGVIRGELSVIAGNTYYLSLWRSEDPEEVAVSSTFDAKSLGAAEREGMRRYLALMKHKVEALSD